MDRLPRIYKDNVRQSTEEFLQDYTWKQRQRELRMEQERHWDEDPMYVIIYAMTALITWTAVLMVWWYL